MAKPDNTSGEILKLKKNIEGKNREIEDLRKKVDDRDIDNEALKKKIILAEEADKKKTLFTGVRFVVFKHPLFHYIRRS